MASMETVSSTAARPSGVRMLPCLVRWSSPRDRSCWVASAHSAEGWCFAGTAWREYATKTLASIEDKGATTKVTFGFIESKVTRLVRGR